MTPTFSISKQTIFMVKMWKWLNWVVLAHHLVRIRLSRYQLRLQSLEILTEALGSTSRFFTHTASRSSQFLIIVVLFISCLSVFTTWQLTFSTVSNLRVNEKEAMVSFII